MIVPVVVEGQSLRWYGRIPEIADNSIEFVQLEFRFPEDWDGMVIVAQFTQTKTYNCLLVNNRCFLPMELVAGPCEVSVFGYLNEEVTRGTTIPLKLNISRSGFVSSAETPIPPTPDLYAQLIDYFSSIAGSGGGGSGGGTINPEDIAAAVEDYLSKNPPEVPDLSDEVTRAETAASEAETASRNASASANTAGSYAMNASNAASSAASSASVAEEAASDAEAAANRAEEAAKVTTDLDTTLTQEGKAADAKAVGDAISKLSGGNVELDTTLTQSGKAADAKAVGDKIAEITGISLVEPAEDDIPKFFYGGALPQTKDDAVMSIRYISKTQDVSGYCETKAQGNSSMSFPKKNQTTKFYKDKDCTEKLKVDFKGWGKQSKFCFKANWIDLTQARNVVSARLWGDVVKSRANYAELPELLRTSPNQGAVDGFPVKVYAAGVYQGRYTLNIPKDAWMANMDDELDTHCILCGENYVSGCFRASANINESDWTDEIHDVVPASIKTRWNQVISFVMNSTDDEFRANLNQYFYVDSLIDYYLFGLASCGLDAFGKNQLYMTYDGQRWIATMYDMDSTWGLWWNGSSIVATDYDRSEYQDFKDGEGNLLYIRLENLFYEELQARWEELRSGALSIDNIINRFERFTDIAPAELVNEDYASTTGDGKFTGIPSKTTSTIQQIRSYAVARHAWCDTYVAALAGGGEVEPDIPDEPDVPETIPCTGITLDKTELTFDGKETQTITATVTPSDTTDTVVWVSSAPTVASISVEGNVCTVQSVANGNAVITVTCGNYSASCSVAVGGIETPNLLESITWERGLFNGKTGVDIDGDQTHSRTSYFDASPVAGKTVRVKADCENVRIACYDANKTNIITKFAETDVFVDIDIPSTAVYLRISVGANSANVTVIGNYSGNLLANVEEIVGYIYGFDTGDFTKISGWNCKKLNVVPSTMYVMSNAKSGAQFNSDDEYIAAIPYISAGQFVETDANAHSAAINYKTEQAGSEFFGFAETIGSANVST